MRLLATIASCALLAAAPAWADQAYAKKRNSEARGAKSCTVRGFIAFVVKVNRNGSAAVTITKDKFPGSWQYFLIGGKRYSGPSDRWVGLDTHALNALKGDAAVKYSYQNWPYRTEGNGEDILSGFKAAYDECIAFLRA